METRISRVATVLGPQVFDGLLHQSLDDRLIDPDDEIGQSDGDVVCREPLGGMLRYYRRQAA